MQEAGVQFHEGTPELDNLRSWLPQGGLLVLDDLMAEGGEDKKLLDLFILIIKILLSYACVKTCFQQENMPRVFPGMLTTS